MEPENAKGSRDSTRGARGGEIWLLLRLKLTTAGRHRIDDDLGHHRGALVGGKATHQFIDS
jgi:hypothetical protein